MNPTLGLIIVVSAGALNGSFALPMKATREWAFENTWLVYSVIAMLLLNWGIALTTIPHLDDVLLRTGFGPVMMVFSFGLIWGLANLLFGAGIALIGISLTFPITIGLSTALGSLIPMAQQPEVFLTPAGMTITSGVAVLLVGVFVCGLAGVRKDSRQKADGRQAGAIVSPAESGLLLKGLVVVLLAGLCDPFLNFAFTFGEPLKHEAAAVGAAAGAESDAVWAVALLGSFVVNTLYCSYKLTRHARWALFGKPGTGSYWILAAAMAAIWMGSITLYGRGASVMGPLGGSVGWALFYCAIIIFSTIWGIVSGEWREASGRPLRTLYAGLAVLIVAIFILGYGNALTTS